VFPSICTSGELAGPKFLKAFDTNNFFSFKKFLQMRRALNSQALNNGKIIRKVCPWKPKQKIAPDEQIATMILESKTKYSQAINLARFTSINKFP
jgi:hypothetical protein